MRLEGKVCIVTGAAHGIGRAYARRFAEEGAIVALSDIDKAALEETVRDLTALGHRTTGYELDISDSSSTDALADRVKADHGRIDVLLNNAAIYRGIRLDDTTEEYLDRVMQVNLWGTWRMSKSAVRVMIPDGGGKIINQGSDAAYIFTSHRMDGPSLPNFNYGMSKVGVHGLTKFMATVLAQYRVTVNCISPGVINTEAMRGGMTDEKQARLRGMIPLGDVLEAEDLTGTAVFFASPDADKITGQILCVDGGMVMPA